MSFIHGVILGSMFLGSKTVEPTYISTPMSGEMIYYGSLLMIGSILASLLLMIYIAKIIVDYSTLKDTMCNVGLYTCFAPRSPRFNRIHMEVQLKSRIETLEEKPYFFLSPLYIAKIVLKKEIEKKLAELKLTSLEDGNKDEI